MENQGHAYECWNIFDKEEDRQENLNWFYKVQKYLATVPMEQTLYAEVRMDTMNVMIKWVGRYMFKPYSYIV